MEHMDHRFRKALTQRLWTSFKQLDTDLNLSSYKNYYTSLSTWVLDHKNSFGESILEKFRLNVLIELDPDEYVIDNPGISLNMEHKRMFGREKPKHIEELARSIGNTLWDLVTNYSEKDCPNCIYDDGLRYVIMRRENPNEEELALNCNSCGRLQNLQGEKLDIKGLEIIPANEKDILKLQ